MNSTRGLVECEHVPVAPGEGALMTVIFEPAFRKSLGMGASGARRECLAITVGSTQQLRDKRLSILHGEPSHGIQVHRTPFQQEWICRSRRLCENNRKHKCLVGQISLQKIDIRPHIQSAQSQYLAAAHFPELALLSRLGSDRRLSKYT